MPNVAKAMRKDFDNIIQKTRPSVRIKKRARQIYESSTESIESAFDMAIIEYLDEQSMLGLDR